MGLDFIEICTKTSRSKTEVYPAFIVGRSKDLMVRGSSLYAVWDEEANTWRTDELDIIPIIDRETKKVYEEVKQHTPDAVPLYLRNYQNQMITKWHNFIKKEMPDNFIPLNGKIIFDNEVPKREDYSSKKVPYHLEDKETPAYTELSTTLYFPEELQKIEWCVGAILSGDSKKLQKFLIITGDAGAGKSTILNIIQMLFDGYYVPFNSKVITSNEAFALEQFKSNPLVAIEHDGNLSRILDNSRLNSLISHEKMMINEKHKSLYSMKFDTFLIMAANVDVEITDAKSGLTRRIIDAEPSGRLLPLKRYDELMKQIKFELGGIAKHCLNVYMADKHLYDNYKPERQISRTYAFYDFIDYAYSDFMSAEYITLDYAWSKYKKYVELSDLKYSYDRLKFKNELREFFKEFTPRKRFANGEQRRNVYEGFIDDRLSSHKEIKQNDEIPNWLKLDKYEHSILDEALKDCQAQYANDDGKPLKAWDDVTTYLKDLKTNELHYVRPPKKMIVIDFDISDENGNKSLVKNVEAAKDFPPTYVETSKSGSGLHLHYIYDGDVSKLKTLYDANIEIKVFNGKASLRRRLTDCNNTPIATLSSGLPLKEDKVVSSDTIKSERGLRNLIIRNLNKEIHPGTKPSVDFIYDILEEAYNNGLKYDVSDMYPTVEAFAMNSTHQSRYCLNMVSKMKFKSDEPSEGTEPYPEDMPIIFYDVEVFPNLFIVCFKEKGEEKVTRMINPSPESVRELFKYKLVGFNNRRYDNHIIYAAGVGGYTNMQLFKLSQRIINGDNEAFFGEAYNLSYADIYEYSSKKQGLKKWEIELDIFHLENAFAWDQPVPEENWDEIADYCCNDVIATEKVAEACHQDFVAREILAKLSGLTVNHTTRQHATKIIFGNNKNPDLVYTDLSETFPGYTFDKTRTPKSLYMGEDPSEGGYVYAEPGIHYNVALLDVASLHPHSIKELNLFGEYTKNYVDILEARIAIKRHETDKVKTMLDGKLAEFIQTEEDADKLAYALKIVINSVYGYTTATFPNPFKDERNVDNIVAKRGALFMIKLKHAVQEMGYQVVHIKTDSIKIANADQAIISFCMGFAKEFGYTFEHEATYEKMCLVNDAVYIAKYADGKHAGEWTATGTQFQVPFVFKTLFSKEPVVFKDMCEVKTVTSSLYLDFNEGLPEDEHDYQFVGRVGEFTPIQSGHGGAILYREKDGKYYAVSNTKKPDGKTSYRWMESKYVQQAGLEEFIDKDYYISMVDNAKAAIEEWGDFNEFAS